MLKHLHNSELFQFGRYPLFGIHKNFSHFKCFVNKKKFFFSPGKYSFEIKTEPLEKWEIRSNLSSYEEEKSGRDLEHLEWTQRNIHREYTSLHWHWDRDGIWSWGLLQHSFSKAGCREGTRRLLHWIKAGDHLSEPAPPREKQNCRVSLRSKKHKTNLYLNKWMVG